MATGKGLAQALGKHLLHVSENRKIKEHNETTTRDAEARG